MRILFAGTPEVALPSLEALLASDHEVLGVITRPDAPAGRGRHLQPSPVARRGLELGLEVLRPTGPKDPDFVARLTEIAPDAVPVVAYGALLPTSVLDIPAHGWINLHFSLLPAWRGAAPVQHAVLAGDVETGATTFRIVLPLDAGPMFAAITEPILPTDSAGDLLARLAERGADLLRETLDGIESGTLTAVEQSEAGITLAPKITVEDARIEWTADAAVVDRRIRGCQPNPGAWTTFRGERFKINSATRTAESLPPGRLVATKRSVRVGTATTALELGQVQAQGKKAMAAPDWARGISLAADESLG